MSNTSASLSAGREDGRTDRCCHPDEGGISSIGSLLPFTFFLGSSLRVIPTQEGSLTEPLPPAYNRFNKRRRPQLGSSATIMGHLNLPSAIAYLRHAILSTPMILLHRCCSYGTYPVPGIHFPRVIPTQEGSLSKASVSDFKF